MGLSVSVDRTPSAKVRWTRRAVALLVANGAVLGGGLAYASWTVSGSGSGTAASGTASPVTMSGSVTGLYPNQKTTLALTVTNPNVNFPVTVSSIQLTSEPAVTGCVANDVTLDGTAAGVNGSTYTPTTNLTIAKNGGTQTYNVPIAAADLENSCQGKTMTLNFTVNATS